MDEINENMGEKDLDLLRLDIGRKYLPDPPNTGEKRLPWISVADVLARAQADGKIPETKFVPVMPDFDNSEFPKKFGFTPDPGIAPLVKVFYRLGIPPMQSCEGHTDRGMGFPYVGFFNENLFRFLALVKDWDEINDNGFIIRIVDTKAEEFRGKHFEFISGYELEKSQSMFERLRKYLEMKYLVRLREIPRSSFDKLRMVSEVEP